jgi:lysozyme
MNRVGVDLVKSFEGLKLDAYRCSANKETIGYGNTFYEDGSKVNMGDKITPERADKLLTFILDKFEDSVKRLVTSELNDNQLSAVVSFAYNCGVNNLKSSTLLKKINSNPDDPTIADEFKKWTRANGKVLTGIVKRRDAESTLYFTKPNS